MAVLLVAVAGGRYFRRFSPEAPKLPDLVPLTVLSGRSFGVTPNSPAIPLLTTLSAEKIPLFADQGNSKQVIDPTVFLGRRK
jgi:hypothetical protein